MFLDKIRLVKKFKIFLENQTGKKIGNRSQIIILHIQIKIMESLRSNKVYISEDGRLIEGGVIYRQNEVPGLP